MKLLKTACLALLAGMIGHRTFAQETPACPDTAETAMYETAKALEWVTDNGALSQGYSQAAAYAGACQDRPVVQFFVAQSFYYIARKLQDPAQQFQLTTAAIHAIRQYDVHATDSDGTWDTGQKREDGSAMTVEIGPGASTLLGEVLVPQIIWFEANGMFHEFVSGKGRSPEGPCPWQDARFAVAEAGGHVQGHEQTAPYFYGEGRIPNIMGSVGRIRYLQSVCPNARKGLASQLGLLYAQTARGADSIGRDEGAATYAGHAAEQYEAFRAIAVTDGTSSARIAATDRIIEEMKELAGGTAE